MSSNAPLIALASFVGAGSAAIALKWLLPAINGRLRFAIIFGTALLANLAAVYFFGASK